MTDMGPREYWTPGKALPESVTDQLREGPTALKHHHFVVLATFTGQGHAGVLWTQYNGIESAVWDVDVYGNPTLRTFARGEDGEDGAARMRVAFRERVSELLAP